MEIEFLGHAGVLIRLAGGVEVAVDPWLADAGNPVATRTADDVAPDVILLTHGHDDHVNGVPELARRHGSLVVGTFELVGQLQESAGLERTHAMHLGGAYTFPFGTVRLTPAFHGSGVPGGHAAGVVLEADGRAFYHAGDTALFRDMELIARRTTLDLAALPIGSNFTMDIEDAAQAVEWLAPGHVIPIHYNTFPVIECDPEAFRRLVESRTGASVHILQPGESMRI